LLLDNRVLFTKVSKEVLALISKGKHIFPKITPSSTPLDISRASLSDCLSLFVEREKKLFFQLGADLKEKMASGKKLFDVWMLESSDTIQAAAFALGSRIVLQQSIAVVEKYGRTYQNGAQDQKTESVLRALMTLYAMRKIEQDLAWYLTSKTLSLEQGAAVSERVRVLCREIAPYALSLVKGFGIPEHLCIAPIAADWVKYNESDEKGEVQNAAFRQTRKA
jgi:acyl-CoA oxidase